MIENIDEIERNQVGFFRKKQNDINSLFQPGDVLECLESSLLHKLKAQETALANWYKIGFRIRMIQAFKMMHQLTDQQEIVDSVITCPNYVITKRSRIRIYWDFVSNIMMTLTYLIIPYQIAFAGPDTRGERDFEIFLDIIIFIDVIMNFFTDSYSDPGKKPLSHKMIAIKYIQSYFFLDLLSFLPQLITLERYPGTHWIYILKLFRYFRIKRSFTQIEDIFKELGGVFKEHHSYNITFVLITVFQFILMFHLMACIWIILGQCNNPNNFWFCGEYDPEDPSPNQTIGWVEYDRVLRGDDYGISKLDPSLQRLYVYVTAFYFITTTASTIGYGDYGAKSPQEMYYMIIVQFVGMIVFSIISGAYKQVI
jgi:hypothetical protein